VARCGPADRAGSRVLGQIPAALKGACGSSGPTCGRTAGWQRFNDGLRQTPRLTFQEFEDLRSGETLSLLQKVRSDSERFINAFINSLFAAIVGIGERHWLPTPGVPQLDTPWGECHPDLGWACARRLDMACVSRTIGGVLLALLATLAAASGAHAKDKITWGWIDNAPGSIPSGPDRNRGIEDQIRALLKERLTGYEHEEVQAPIPRVISEIKSGSHWCATGFVKTAERETFAQFSLPAAFWLPPRIVVRRDRRADFESSGELSLEKLLATRTLRTGVVRGRAYSPAIDALLQQHPPAELHSDYIDGLKMLLSDRLDYVIELPIRAAYTTRRLGSEGQLVGLPFKEMSNHITTHLMCPKNDWGRQVVAEIDAVLRAERGSPRYRQIIETWSDDDSVRQIRRIYDTVLLKTD
jgi:polar amino acid transport system substrate-binding protein